MMRIATLLLLLMVLASCEKPILSDNEEEVGSDGNLMVTIANTDLSATRLNIAVYDMAGKRVKQVNQQSGSASFGTAGFQLATGDYQIVVVAHSSNGNPTMASLGKIQFTNTQGFTDTLLGMVAVSVSDEQVRQSVTLHRIVSLCRVIFEDNYPSDVRKLRFYYTGGSGAFDASTGLGCVNSRQSVFFEIANGQKQFDLYTFLHDTQGTIHLAVTAYDASDNVLQERDFDVPLSQCQTTCLKGSFFSDSPFTVNAAHNASDWDEEYHMTF